jgi:hypothetical protein
MALVIKLFCISMLLALFALIWFGEEILGDD